ncbi:MAG: AAA family ATPase [Clostridiales bacterium]|uniref:ATPase/GTPase, AAA15 family n=1 Tax=Peptococcus niger TaxID=2741 RepID=A0A1G6RK32_PEPNI|nr:AAA family ATPase [Peptococcus niger]MDU1028968.1 AAA family ATPase [Clostridiales bacterium]SDD05009.1 ATPase/GTPase, AAA15 family [Peptococcus niger]
MKNYDLDPLELGYKSNKEVRLSAINSIFIENFRTLKNREIPLGKNITLITGKNGTMKSSILGLIAHPFSSPNNAKDIFGLPLKTSMSDVFRLSLEKDEILYRYYLNATTIKGEKISEVIRVYPRLTETDQRHRVTVGKDNKKGRGNFLLNTSYTNFLRLFPIINTEASEVDLNSTMSSDTEEFITSGYLNIMQREAFRVITPVSDSKKSAGKNTIGPKDALYDFNSISSGEDSLGYILCKMAAFQDNKVDDGALEGIFCIDEIEAGLHPIAQENLFDFLLNWSIANKIQVVATTHSLYLIQHALSKQKKLKLDDSITINMISTAFVDNDNYIIRTNPSYGIAYKELTLKEPEDLNNLSKVNIICEDKKAETLIRRVLKKKEINQSLEYITALKDNQAGNSYQSLNALIKNGPKLFSNSIVIYDPDVDSKAIPKKSVSTLQIPSFCVNQNLCIELSIVQAINDLDGSSPFFKKNNKEKAVFLNEFSKYNLFTKIGNLSARDTQSAKKWAQSDKKFNTYITWFVNNTNLFNTFRRNLMECINQKRKALSLPEFDI